MIHAPDCISAPEDHLGPCIVPHAHEVAADPVHHPAHYAQDGPIHKLCGRPIECIDVAQMYGFSIGSAIKYLWRAGKKDPAKTVEDYRKAIQFIQFEIDRVLRDT